MADLSISQLPSASVPSGSDVLPIVQGGVTDQITVTNLGNGIFRLNLPLTASGLLIGGNIIPSVSKSFSLGSTDFPFRDIYISSGSLIIASDTPGDPSTTLSNVAGNILISAGGMQLVGSGSFNAATGSFQYQTGSLNYVGEERFTGSFSISGSFTSSLQQNYVWLGNSSNRSTPVPISTLAVSGGFFTTSSFGFYGAFYSTSSQTNPVANVSRSMTFLQTQYSNGVTIVSGSRMTVTNAGAYNLAFSSQLEKTSNGTDTVYIWFKKNGSNIPDSATAIDVTKQAGGGGKVVAAWNYIDTYNAGDYVEIVWQAADTTMQLSAFVASGNIPVIPSVIATLNQVS